MAESSNIAGPDPIGIEGKQFTQVPRSKLMAHALTDPVIADNQDIPVYVNVGNIPAKNDRPHARLHELEGKKFIVVNESYHKWSPEYVSERLMYSDAQLAEGLATPERFAEVRMKPNPLKWEESEVIEQRKQRFEEIIAFAAGGPDGKGGVQVDIAPIRSPATFAATTSKEGTKHVIIREDQLLDAMESDKAMAQAKAAIGHEFHHHTHQSPEQMAATHNERKEKQREILADLHTGDSASLIARHKATFANEIRDYVEGANPNSPIPEDAIQLMKAASAKAASASLYYPSTYERIAALEAKDALSATYDKQHPGADPKAREIWVNARIIEQYEKGELPPPASLLPSAVPPKTLPGLSPEALQKLGGMEIKLLPMQDVATHSASQAPAAARGPRELD